MKVRIAYVDQTRNRLRLSLNTTASGDESSSNIHLSGLSRGSIVSGTITAINKEKRTITLSLKDSPGIHVTLPQYNLSDHVENAEALFNTMAVGTTIDDLIITRTPSKKNASTPNQEESSFIVCAKPSLYMGIKKGFVPSHIDQVVQDKVYMGIASGVQSYGIFINYLGKVKSLIPIANIADERITNINDKFVQGQVLLTRVVSLNREESRITAATKISSVTVVDEDNEDDIRRLSASSSLFLISYLSEKYHIAKSSDTSGKKIKELKGLKYGQLLTAKVTSKDENGYSLSFTGLDSSIKGFCSIKNAPVADEDIVVAKKKSSKPIDCHVIDIDFNSGVVEVSMNLGKEPKSAELLSKANGNGSTWALILSVNAMYAVARVQNDIILISTQGYNGKMDTDIEVGSIYQVQYCADDDMMKEFGVNNSIVSQKGLPNLLTNLHVYEIISSASAKNPRPNYTRTRARSLSMNSENDEGNENGEQEKVQVKENALVQCRVYDIASPWMNVKLINVSPTIEGTSERTSKYRCSVHITDTCDLDNKKKNGNAKKLDDSGFSTYSVGDTLTARVILIDDEKKSIKLSLRPSELIADDKTFKMQERITWNSPELSPGVVLDGVIQDTKQDSLVIGFSSSVSGVAFCTFVSKDLEILEKAFGSSNDQEKERKRLFPIGKFVRAKIIGVHPKVKQLDVSLLI